MKKTLKNGALHYLDRLGDPFLFLEERVVQVEPGTVQIAINTLPKLVFVLEGSMQVDVEGAGTTALKPGSVLVNFRHLRQTYHSGHPSRGAQMKVLRLTLPWEKIERKAGTRSMKDDFASFLRNGLPAFGIHHCTGRVPWDQWLREARLQFSSREGDRRFRAHAALRMVLLEIVRNWQNSDSAGSKETDTAHRLQQRIDSYLEEHLDEPITLADIAAAVDRSEEHVSRVYRQQRGTTLFDEIKRLRIERSTYFLLCTDLNITRIAEQSGFATLAHFSRSFRQNYGKSPQQFRAQH